SASSISFKKSPLPPTRASDTSARRSPEVRITTSSTLAPSPSRRRATSLDWASARALPRVPRRRPRASLVRTPLSRLVVTLAGCRRRDVLFGFRRRLEGEQTVHQLGDLRRRGAVVVARNFLEHRERRVEDLVDDRLGHRFERPALRRL